MHIVEGRISFPFGQNQNNKGAGSTDKVSIISKICHATQDNDHATLSSQTTIEPKIVTLGLGFILFYLIRG